MQTYANKIFNISYTPSDFIHSVICLCFFNHNISFNIDLLETEDFQCASDIGFLMDGSGSICRDPGPPEDFRDRCLNWIHMINFLLILVKYMGLAADGTHASVALFSDNPNDPYHHQIAFNDFWDIDGFLEKVSTITYPQYKTTASTLALDRSLNDMFNVANNGMRENKPKTLLFLSDGRCSHGTAEPNPVLCRQPEFERLKEVFSRRNIKVIGIGVGLTVNDPGMEQLGWLTDIVRRTDEFDDLYNPNFALSLDLCQGSPT